MAIDTAGFQMQSLPIQGFSPVSPQLAAGANTAPAVAGALAQFQLANAGSESKYLTGIEPSQQAATTNANLLAAKKSQYLAGLNPAQAMAFDKGGPPTSQIETGGHLDADGNWVSSVQTSVTDPTTGQSFATGEQKQLSRPTSSLVKVVQGGTSGENIAQTTTFAVKPGSPAGAVALETDPATGELRPTQWAQAVHTDSVPVQHYAPAQKGLPGVAADALKTAQQLTAEGKEAQAAPYWALYNSFIGGNEKDQALAQQKVDSMKKKDEIASVGKDPISVNAYTQRQLEQTITDMKAAGAKPEAIQEQQSYLDAAKARGAQLKAQADAKTLLTNAQANQVGGKNATSLAQENIRSLTTRINMANAAIASSTIKDTDKQDFIKERTRLQSELKAAQDAAAPNATTSNLSGGQLPTITSQEDYDALKPGAQYIDPQGVTRTKQ